MTRTRLIMRVSNRGGERNGERAREVWRLKREESRTPEEEAQPVLEGCG